MRRLSDSLEEWEQESKRRRMENEAVKLECDDANDAYAFPSASNAPATVVAPAPATHMLAPASAPAPAHPMPV